MNPLPILLCAGLGLAIALGLIPLILKLSQTWGWAHGARDAHHTHRMPVPRLGGLALAVSFVFVELVAVTFYPVSREQAADQLTIIFSTLAMFTLGFWDDIKPLGARKKLAAQVAVAAVVYAAGIRIDILKLPFLDIPAQSLGFLSLPVTVLWLVGLTNLINLVDGVDGLAGGICLMLMLLMAYVGQQTCNLHLMAAGLAGALVGFLWFNFPPARIYMGDGGAYFLGFLIGIMTIVSSQKGAVIASLMAPLFVLALPILDTSLAIARRGLQGLPLFRPDRRHIHHRLLESGLPQRKIVLGIYGFTAVFLLMGFAAFWSKGLWIPNLVGLGMLVVLLMAGQLNFSREWFAVGRVLGNSLEMRQEVQYALSLTNWLALAGLRSPSLADLWEDLIFVARKLGFTHLKLRLEDGERVWSHPADAGAAGVRREVLNGSFGTLEVGIARFAGAKPAEAATEALPAPGARPTLADETLFIITGELLAEGWLKAARGWTKTHRQPVRFDAALGQPNVVSLDEARRTQPAAGPPA